MDFLKQILTANPNASDPAIAAAAGITRDSNGVLSQRRTAESDQLAENLGTIAGMAQGAIGLGSLTPEITYTAIPRALPYSTEAIGTLGGQQLLGMYKYVPTVVGTSTQLATKGNSVKGLAGTIALGVAAGQGNSDQPQRNKNISAPKVSSTTKTPTQTSYKQLLALQKVYGGNLIKQRDGTYYLKNKNGYFFGNGRALNTRTGKMQNYDLYGTGRFINSTPKQQISNNQPVSSVVLDKNYLYRYKGKQKLANKNSFKNAWTNARNSGLKTFTWNGKLYNTMKRGESKQQYNTWLNNQTKPKLTKYDLISNIKASDIGSLTSNPTINTDINSLTIK